MDFRHSADEDEAVMGIAHGLSQSGFFLDVIAAHGDLSPSPAQ
jgi:hypothetical protein